MNSKVLKTGLAAAAMVMLTACGDGMQARIAEETTIPAIPYIEETSSAARLSAAGTETDKVLMLDTAAAKELMYALDTVDRIGACAVAYDANTEYKNDDGEIYYKAEIPNFENTADLREFMNNYLTDDFIGERYSFILDGNSPFCIDIGNTLFIKYMPRGGGFAFTDKEPSVEKISDDKYQIIAEHDNYGTVENMRIDVVKDNGGFKIDGFSIN